MQQIAGWEECFKSISNTLTRDRAAFIGRMGGSDTDAVAAWISGSFESVKAGREAALAHLARVRQFNGYYDKKGSPETYIRFLDTLRHCYLNTRQMALVDAKLLSMYFPQNLNPRFLLSDIRNRDGFEALVQEIDHSQMDWIAYPYTFYETLKGPLNLIRVFEVALPGKRVCVITPFVESIKKNWHNRAQFFRDYAYPDFSIAFVEAPITYDGLPLDYYPHDDWFATLDALRSDLSALDFDIALLSCGSYAMPLGSYIRDTLKRKAIYVGGIFQLFFGIMGRRYDNPFFLDAINVGSFIQPVEKPRFFNHVKLPDAAPTEHFGAYF